MERTFDELDVAELSSDGGSTSDQDNQQQSADTVNDCTQQQPALEPGLTSKPPIHPTGNAQQETFGRETTTKNNSVTFDDAIELKFQRWFPNSAPTVTPSAGANAPALNGMSSYHEYSESVIDNDKGTITYTRSSSSMSIRGSQDQLDEEHLYSNLSAAIGTGDRQKTSVSVDLLDILQNDDNRRVPSALKSKKKKKSVPVVHKVKKDAPKTLQRPKHVVVRNNTCSNKPKEMPGRNEQIDLEKEIKKDHPRKTDDSPVDEVKEDVVSWMSSHQRPSTPEFNDTFVSVLLT